MKNINITFENIKLDNQQLLEQQDFYTASELIKKIQNYLYNLSFDIGQNLEVLGNSLDQISSVTVNNQIEVIRKQLNNVIFFKQMVPQCEDKILLKAIQNSLTLTLDYLIKNTVGKITEKVAKIINNFSNIVSEHIKQQKLLRLKESINDLKIIHDQLNLRNTELYIILEEIDKLVIRFNLSINLNDLKILEFLENEHQDQCRAYLKNTIEAIYKTAQKQYYYLLKCIQQIIHNEINILFKKFCNDIIKAYGHYDSNKLKEVELLHNAIKNLIISYDKKAFSFLSMIYSMQKIIVDNTFNLNISAILLIKNKLEEISKIQNNGIEIQEPDVVQYLEILSKLVVQINI